MKLIRRNAKLASAFLSILVLFITVPFDSVLAVMVGTEAILNSTRAQQFRDKVNNMLLREDVQNALMAHGIDPLEAKARIDSLSDTEVMRIAYEIDKLPAAGATEMFAGCCTPPAWVIAAVVAIFIVPIIVVIVWWITIN